jgi:hypothetical protein
MVKLNIKQHHINNLKEKGRKFSLHGAGSMEVGERIIPEELQLLCAHHYVSYCPDLSKTREEEYRQRESF